MRRLEITGEMMPLVFAKYHGLGNDFLIIDAHDIKTPMTAERTRRLCDRHRGVGGDGVLLATREGTRWRMTVFNADGGQSEMCGNGLRCFARWLIDTQRCDAPLNAEQHHKVIVETGAGALECRVDRDRAWVEIELGDACFERAGVPMLGEGTAIEAVEAGGKVWTVRGASVGNPHAVIVVPAPIAVDDAERYGETIGHSPLFPNRANVEFCHLRDDGSVHLVVYERGCGITQACGTGAGATIAVLAKFFDGYLQRPVPVDLPGGRLFVTVNRSEDVYSVWLRGPAIPVFSGEIAD